MEIRTGKTERAAGTEAPLKNEHTPPAARIREQASWGRLLVYAGLLAFLAALLYREASLERPLGSWPVMFVCLAGVSHILCGYTRPQASLHRLLSWSRWVFVAVGAVLSVRLMFPI